MPTKFLSTCLLLLCLLTPGQAAPADTFSISGAVAHPGAWNLPRVEKDLPGRLHPVTYTLKGKAHTARVVALWDILNAAQLQAASHVKNARLRLCVLVTGRDGYAALFSLAELLPDVGARRVWVAFAVDGKPLPTSDAPAALLVPQDGKAGRWVHGIASIAVTRAR